jgi:hypothetical protein
MREVARSIRCGNHSCHDWGPRLVCTGRNESCEGLKRPAGRVQFEPAISDRCSSVLRSRRPPYPWLLTGSAVSTPCIRKPSLKLSEPLVDNNVALTMLPTLTPLARFLGDYYPWANPERVGPFSSSVATASVPCDVTAFHRGPRVPSSRCLNRAPSRLTGLYL